MPGEPASFAELPAAVERLARIPDRYREFSETSDVAVRLHRVPHAVLERLIGAGLPYAGRGDDRRFDPLDLKNVGLALQLESPQRMLLRRLCKTLQRADAGAEVHRAVDVRFVCPAAGHDGPCRFEIDPGDRARLLQAGVVLVADNHVRVEVTLPAGRRDLPASPQQLQLVAELARFEFHHLPAALSGDLGFMRDTGLADCTLASRYLVQRGREMDVEVRPVGGLYLAEPFPFPHVWVELRHGAEWVPADPFFLGALVRWQLLAAAEWPPLRSPHSVAWKSTEHVGRFAGEPGTGPAAPDRGEGDSRWTWPLPVVPDGVEVAPFVRHAGIPVLPSVMVRRE